MIIGLAAIASLKPIHLLQESDCMQYHYTLPRQHLILGSFAHIPWAADDLFLLPVDYALASFWFTTALPNKIPQFIIFLGLIVMVMRLTSAFAGEKRPWAGPAAALAVLGTHGFGIQMGTGMLDLAVAYLFLAALDSLRLGLWFLAAVELTFFIWSKPLMPLEALTAISILGLFYAIARRNHWQTIQNLPVKHWKKILGLFALLSVIVAGPFAAKGIHYAGTPLFPFGLGLIEGADIKNYPAAWESLQKAVQSWMAMGHSYGHGKDLAAFIKHWWLVAVPEKDVNNVFDYPLGLTYLLMIGPFLFFLGQDVARRQFSALSILAAIIWVLWWLTVQQSRFLYVPLLLMFIVTIARMQKMSKVLGACLLLSLLLEAASLWGAHKKDIRQWGTDVVRGRDRQLLELNSRYLSHSLKAYISWPSHDVAYAQFPVIVRQENLPHTMKVY